MEDLTAASLEDVEQFFRTFYTPDNAVLSIAGDFDVAEARRLVEKHFGPIPRGSGKPFLKGLEVPTSFGKTLRLVVEDDVSLPRIYLAFRSPVFGSEGYYAASVAGAVLGMKQGSRLYRSLVREKQIAADASAFTFDLAKGTDLLVLDVTGRPEISAEQLEAEVEREVDLLIEQGASDEEVQRAVALIQTDMVTAMQSASERADRLSMFATLLGDPSLINMQAEKYSSVTTESVNDFVRERLRPDNRAKLIYVPRQGQVADTEEAEVEALVS
jgi:predicted Zn-dependent peptidase